jgi:hypothetical protein
LRHYRVKRIASPRYRSGPGCSLVKNIGISLYSLDNKRSDD